MVRLGVVLLAGCGFHATGGGGGDDATGVDAAPDARPFDVTRDCPAGYGTVNGIPPTSRYRMAAPATYRNAHDDCRDDQLGYTHLAVLGSRAEADALFDLGSDAEYWAGAVQQPSQGNPTLGWFAITGGPVVMAVWAADEPDESGNTEANVYNVAKWASDGLDDDQLASMKVVMCECDGLAVDPTIAGYIR